MSDPPAPRSVSEESTRESPAAEKAGISRRQVLGAMAVAAGGSLALAGNPALAADTRKGEPEPVKHINKTFRALVRMKETGPSEFITLHARQLVGRQVLIRVDAVQCCYTDVGKVFGPYRAGFVPLPIVIGHTCTGTVEEIGPTVRGVNVGDRVISAVTSHCGRCYQCLRGRADVCVANGLPPVPVGEMPDGTPMLQNGAGGNAEYAIVYEERCVPIFSKISTNELAMLACVGSTGLGMTSTLHPIESGSSVVVFGAGPVGLSAIQGARIAGATQIICVEPIAARRQLALTLGATDAVDPNKIGDKLLEQLRSMTKGTTDRIFTGGRDWSRPFGAGPDYVIEAVGADQYPPKAEAGPDPSGLKTLELIWNLCPAGGWGMTSGGGYDRDGKIALPAGMFTNGSKTFCACQNGGIHSRRDLPRYVELIERGLFDAKSMITETYRFEDVHKAYQAVADRTIIAAVVTFT